MPIWIILSRMAVQRDSFPRFRLDRFSCRFGSRSEFTDNAKRWRDDIRMVSNLGISFLVSSR
jgi:hypothetical protein